MDEELKRLKDAVDRHLKTIPNGIATQETMLIKLCMSGKSPTAQAYYLRDWLSDRRVPIPSVQHG